jgi:hypothetical protein
METTARTATHLFTVRPESGEFAPYHQKYLELVPDTDLQTGLSEECERTMSVLRTLSEEDGLLCHPPYTWTLRQVVSHIVDTERIFVYRALRIARGDSTPRAGFDENAFALVAERDGTSMVALADDYEACRVSTLGMLRALPEAGWRRRGVANGFPVSARAMAWLVLGHERHHMRIVRQRLGRS